MNRREFVHATGAATALATLPRLAGAQDTKIATRPIPASGEPMPVIGYGGSPVFSGDDFAASIALLDALRDAGGQYIDTWPQAQGTYGRYISEHAAPEDLFLATNVRSASAAEDLAAIRAAKLAQGQAVLDLLQLPQPDDFRAQWDRMRRWRDEGHVRYIGIAIARSSFYEIVEAAIRNGADFVQINYSMLEPESGERLIPLAADQGVAVVTNRPFVNGEYFPRVGGHELPAWAADFDCHSWAQFSLKWILGNPQVTCAITETSKLHHAVDNLGAGLGRVPDEAERSRMLAHLQSL